MDNIDIFNNTEIIMTRKMPSKIVSWITVLIIGLVIFLFISIFYKYNDYIYLDAKVLEDNEKFYLQTYLNDDYIKKISKATLIVDGIEQVFIISKITPSYYNDSNSNNIYEVLLEAPVNQKLNINNNIVELRFKLSQTTLINKFMTNIKKELG